MATAADSLLRLPTAIVLPQGWRDGVASAMSEAEDAAKAAAKAAGERHTANVAAAFRKARGELMRLLRELTGMVDDFVARSHDAVRRNAEELVRREFVKSEAEMPPRAQQQSPRVGRPAAAAAAKQAEKRRPEQSSTAAAVLLHHPALRQATPKQSAEQRRRSKRDEMARRSAERRRQRGSRHDRSPSPSPAAPQGPSPAPAPAAPSPAPGTSPAIPPPAHHPAPTPPATHPPPEAATPPPGSLGPLERILRDWETPPRPQCAPQERESAPAVSPLSALSATPAPAVHPPVPQRSVWEPPPPPPPPPAQPPVQQRSVWEPTLPPDAAAAAATAAETLWGGPRASSRSASPVPLQGWAGRRLSPGAPTVSPPSTHAEHLLQSPPRAAPSPPEAVSVRPGQLHSRQPTASPHDFGSSRQPSPHETAALGSPRHATPSLRTASSPEPAAHFASARANVYLGMLQQMQALRAQHLG